MPAKIMKGRRRALRADSRVVKNIVGGGMVVTRMGLIVMWLTVPVIPVVVGIEMDNRLKLREVVYMLKNG